MSGGGAVRQHHKSPHRPLRRPRARPTPDLMINHRSARTPRPQTKEREAVEAGRGMSAPEQFLRRAGVDLRGPWMGQRVPCRVTKSVGCRDARAAVQCRPQGVPGLSAEERAKRSYIAVNSMEVDDDCVHRVREALGHADWNDHNLPDELNRASPSSPGAVRRLSERRGYRFNSAPRSGHAAGHAPALNIRRN